MCLDLFCMLSIQFVTVSLIMLCVILNLGTLEYVCCVYLPWLSVLFAEF